MNEELNKEIIISDINKILEMLLSIHEGLNEIYKKLSTIKKEAELHD
jgi:hypothetical protein